MREGERERERESERARESARERGKEIYREMEAGDAEGALHHGMPMEHGMREREIDR